MDYVVSLHIVLGINVAMSEPFGGYMLCLKQLHCFRNLNLFSNVFIINVIFCSSVGNTPSH